MAERITHIFSCPDAFSRLAGRAGSALVSFSQTGAGAVLRPLQSRLREILSVKDFGAVGDGTTDDSTAIQNCVNAACAGDGMVFFPAEAFNFANIEITAPIMICGSGGASMEPGTATLLRPTTATSTLFTVNCLGGVTFQDFAVRGRPQTAGDLFVVKHDGAASNGIGNIGTRFNNVSVDIPYNAINFECAVLYSVTGCGFWNIVNRGIVIENTFNSDQGDGCIEGNFFSGGAASTALHWDRGGAGLRFTNNKTLTPIAISGDLAVTQSTGQMLISNNSFDNLVTAAITLQCASGTETFGTIVITDNIFGAYAGMSRMVDVRGIAGAHISHVLISNNLLFQSGGPMDTMISGDYIDGLLISNNYIFNSAAAGTRIGIELGPNCTDVILQGNLVRGCATDITNLSAVATWTQERATDAMKQLFMDFTNSATVGAVQIDKASGRCNIAAGASTVTVTNSLVNAASKVFAVPAATDANNVSVRSVVPGAGSFTITMTGVVAANQAIDFFVVNVN